jgi:hypothetical protein
MEGLLDDIMIRLTLVERRLGRGTGGSPYVLPSRLGVTGAWITDMDQATETGWYRAESPANAPNNQTAPWQIMVQVSGPEGVYPGRLIQEAVLLTADVVLRTGKWTRWLVGSTWSGWQQMKVLSGPLTITSSASAIYKDTPFTFPAGFFTVAPEVVIGNQVNNSGAMLMSQAINVTVTGATARTSIANATSWGTTYNVVWIATQRVSP